MSDGRRFVHRGVVSPLGSGDEAKPPQGISHQEWAVLKDILDDLRLSLEEIASDLLALKKRFCRCGEGVMR